MVNLVAIFIGILLPVVVVGLFLFVMSAKVLVRSLLTATWSIFLLRILSMAVVCIVPLLLLVL